MRFKRLDLLRFGPFTDQGLDFGESPAGFHLVFGPNEAGKSATLRAIHGALFGIPHRSNDTFLHKGNALRIGAILENRAGAALAYVRRKGRSKTLLNPAAGDAPFGEEVLQPFLAGMDAKTFSQLYGIDHEQLEEGGKELQRLRGLAGESLLAAGMGITDLSGVLATLDEEAKDLFERRKNSRSAIQKVRREHEEWRKQRSDAEVSAHRWQTLQRTLRKKQGSRKAVVKRLDEHRRERERLKLLRSVLKSVGRRAKLQGALDELSDVTVLPTDHSVEARERHQKTLEQAQRDEDSARGQLEGDDGLRAQIAAIEIPDGLLEQEPNIDALTEQLGVYKELCRDLPKRETARGSQLRDGKVKLAQLGLDVELSKVDSLRVPDEFIARIQTLGLDERTVRPKPKALRTSSAGRRKALQQAREDLQGHPSPPDPASLRAAAERARKEGALEQQLDNLRVEWDSSRDSAADQLAALGLYQGPLDQVHTLSVPVRSAVERFARELAELEAALSQCQADADVVLRRRGKDQQTLDEVRLGGAIPATNDLAAARARREASWQVVRREWLAPGSAAPDGEARGVTDTTALAATYEGTVKDADQVADALREHAELVTRVEVLEGQIKSADGELHDLDGQREQYESRAEELNGDWQEAWSAAGMKDPWPPVDMLQWLTRFDDLCGTVKALRSRRDEIGKREGDIARHKVELGTELATLGGDEPAEDETLASLLDRCDRLVLQLSDERQARQAREDELNKEEEALASLEADAEEAEQELERWQTEWSKALEAIRCGPDTSAELANLRIDLLKALFKHIDEAEALSGRIRGIEVAKARFEDDVRAMVSLVAPDLADLPADQAAAELGARTKRANLASNELAGLRERAAGLEDEIQALQEPRRLATDALASLCEQAGVERHELLAAAERASQDKLDLQEDLDNLDTELLELGGGLAVQELIEQARGRDASSLTAKIESLDYEIKIAETELETASGDVRDAQRELESVDGSAAAAEADQEMLGLVGRAQQGAEQYIRLRLAASLLRRQIEDQRAKTQDPVLQRARELFRRLTCGSFADLKIDYDSDDIPLLKGDRGDGSKWVPLEGFSDGTADQLYLALRIAYLERNLTQGEPMPIIADDILVNFDDQRARATLEVLAELSQKTQVLLLTHHDHLRQLAREVVPATDLFEHELSTGEC